MIAVRISGQITEDKKLIVDIPDDLPAGPVELVIRPLEQPTAGVENPAREAARARLAAAGALSTAHHLKEPFVVPTEEELLEAGTLPSDARPSEDIIRELREDD
ncbi:MAG: hypothetical protein SF029_23915 [bacterium]|nr:hypothetical protein [bacterium]